MSGHSPHRTLSDNTHHSRETDIHVPGGIITHNPQTHVLDCAATEID
jgi:hypothetical protein